MLKARDSTLSKSLPYTDYFQPAALHPSTSVTAKQHQWVIYNEFILTTEVYLRTVSEVQPEWLLELAPAYFDLVATPDSDSGRALQRLTKKMKNSHTDSEKAENSHTKKVENSPTKKDNATRRRKTRR